MKNNSKVLKATAKTFKIKQVELTLGDKVLHEKTQARGIVSNFMSVLNRNCFKNRLEANMIHSEGAYNHKMINC